MSKSEYEKIRKSDASKADKKYQEKASNAFKFIDFTKWYVDRGTDEGGNWLKDPTLGHRMAKTKYDYSGTADKKAEDSSKGSIFGGF